MTPARRRSHSASNPTNPVVTSPSMVTPSSSASNCPVATRPHAVKAGPCPCASSLALERWNALRSRMSSPVMVCASASRPALVAHSGSPKGSSSSTSGSAPASPMRLIPPTMTCEPPAPSSLVLSASTTCDPTVLPKRSSQARGITSELLMVPMASPSTMRAPEAFESVSVIVSLPSSWLSSSTATSIVFAVSPAAKLSVPLSAV